MNGVRKYSNETLRAYRDLALMKNATSTYEAIQREINRRVQAAPQGEVA